MAASAWLTKCRPIHSFKKVPGLHDITDMLYAVAPSPPSFGFGTNNSTGSCINLDMLRLDMLRTVFQQSPSNNGKCFLTRKMCTHKHHLDKQPPIGTAASKVDLTSRMLGKPDFVRLSSHTMTTTIYVSNQIKHWGYLKFRPTFCACQQILPDVSCVGTRM